MQGNIRTDSNSISMPIVLCLTNHISAKKHLRVLRALYRITDHYGCRKPTFVLLHTYGKLVTKTTEVSEHSKAFVRIMKSKVQILGAI